MYFPWVGFFELVATADVYIHLDDAQFSKGSFTNRVQLKQAAGSRWLTVPLEGKGSFQKIHELRSTGEAWRDAHRLSISQALAGAPHLAHALALFDEVIATEPLSALLVRGTELLSFELGVAPARIYMSSGLGINTRSWRRVLDLVLAVGGTRYVTAHGAAEYLDHEAFEREGVEVEYIDYSLTPWPQYHGAFTPYVTVLDLIAHSGEKARRTIDPKTTPWRVHLSRRTIK